MFRSFVESVGGDKLAIAGGISVIAIYVATFATVIIAIATS